MKNPHEAQITHLLGRISKMEGMIVTYHEMMVELRLKIARYKREIADLELNTIVTPSVAERR